ncbi:MAG: M23 family metallopeptidase [Verrucomicrobiales bacterium]|nr:M23 family metallopeptidase [Verrucomicrobiales bacterium]
MMRPAALFLLLSTLLPVSILQAGPFGLVLPTENDAIFSSDPSQFYMYTDRNFEGVTSKPWQGGTYGFSRNQRRTSVGIVYTRFHEGVDIRPVSRDSNNNPLDDIYSIAAGTVVYVNSTSSLSNYGKYIVVHHDWGEGPFFSLYAHLSSATAVAGQQVRAGEKIAKMGYTGAGLNRERAHVHVELGMILSDHFQRWYDRHFTSQNHHGIFSGINLIGIDIAELFKAHRANPNISIAQFLAAKTEVHYRVLVPKSGQLEFLRRYPWLGRDLKTVRKPKSWEFAFAATGVPLEIRPSSKSLSYPAITYIKPSGTDHSYLTSGRVSGNGSTGKLTPSGSRYVQLITDSF